MQLEQSTYARICYQPPALIRYVPFSANISMNAYCSTRPAMRESWHRLTTRPRACKLSFGLRFMYLPQPSQARSSPLPFPA